MKILVELDTLERVVELLDIYQNAEVKLPTVYDAKHMLIAAIKNGAIIKEEINQPVSGSAYSFMNKPDPRCDGCEYQHPYLKNMMIGGLNDVVYCERGSHPPYYKEGKTIKYDPALMLCYRVAPCNWVNPTDKPSDITDEDRKWADKEIEKHIEAANREAIIETLEILLNSGCCKGENCNITTTEQVEKLRTKLVGEK